MMPLKKRRVPGFVCIIFGCWLVWDMATTLAVRPVILDGWRFCLPFFIACVNSGDWTFVMDLAFTLILGGAVLGMVDEWPKVPIRQSQTPLNWKDVLLVIIIAVALGSLLIILLIALLGT
jgi:hypothetical protein